jgi:hypothetical protein
MKLREKETTDLAVTHEELKIKLENERKRTHALQLKVDTI